VKQKAVILQIELQGIQTLSENLPPVELENLIVELHKLFDTTLKLHNGALKDFTGDNVLGIYPENQTKTPAAVHALDSAFALKEQLQAIVTDKIPDHPVGLKTGISSGVIIETFIGSGENRRTNLLGDAIKNAERICQFAENGQILVGQSVFESSKDHFEFQSLEPIPLKGGADSLAIFEPVSKKRKKLELKTTGERKIASEMVGRSREMEQMEGLFKQLLAGKGYIVNVVGKAGIGKSRLIAEMKVQPVMEKVQMLEGRALSTGQNLSYHPIIHLIKSWAGITEDDPPALSSEKLLKGIRHIASDLADDIYAFLAAMMGLPLAGKYAERVHGIEGDALEKLILKNLRDLIIAATKDKPRIYLIEDMHWSDASSIKLFESLYKLSQHHPVMFVNVLRPGYPETGDHILKYLVDHFPVDHTTIHINPLDVNESGDLIHNLLRDTHLPAEIENMIIRKTDGNPFFIEEVIRSLIDDDIIAISEGEFIVTGKINHADIPDTINEAILSRVDKLDEKTRELLNTASVMGRNFYYKVLEEATDTIGELDERLAYLTEVQLIAESKKKQDIEYLFKHALSHQLTYDALLQQSRKALHLKIAKSIEKVFARNLSEFYGILAYHYTKAEHKEKTTQYLILAGDESLKSGASSEALNFYMQAMELLPHERINDPKDKEIRDLSYNIAISQHTLGKNDLAVPLYEAIMKKYFNFRFAKTEKGLLARGIVSILMFRFMINNQSLFFRKKMTPELDFLMKLFNNWGYAYVHLNPKQFAFKGLKALVFNSLHEIPKSNHALSFFIDTAILFNFTGISLTTAKKIIEYSEKAGVAKDPQSFINYRMISIIQQYFSGNWLIDEDFAETYHAGLRIGKYWTTFTYVYYSGMCAIESGNYKAFQERVDLLEDFAETLDVTYAMILKYRLATMGYLKFRRLDKLREITDTGIDFVRMTGDDANLFMIYCMRAQGMLYVGRINEAKEAMEKVADKMKKHARVPIFHSQYLLSSLELNLKMLEETPAGSRSYSAIFHDVKKISDKFIAVSNKNPATLPTAYLMKARIAHILHKKGGVYRNLKKALIAGEKYHGRLELSRAYFETGKFLSDPNVKYKELNGHPAGYYLEQALNLFEKMDLQWDLEEYRRYEKSIKIDSL
jgi:class 3 adenylate cyclase